MKFLLMALISLTCLSVSLCAGESQGIYAGGFGGLDLQSLDKHSGIKTDIGFSGGLFSGYKFCNNIRIEGELSYKEIKWKCNVFVGNEDRIYRVKDHARFQTISLMANALYDFDLHPRWTPYLGGGIGYAHLFSNKNYSNNKVALQAIAGISYSICPKTDLGLEYRFFRAGVGTDDNSFVISLKQYF